MKEGIESRRIETIRWWTPVDYARFVCLNLPYSRHLLSSSSLLRWSNPGHQSRQTLTTFSPAFRHADRSISNLLAKGKLITRLVTHALHSNFSLMLENLYPKVFYTSSIFLCDRMDSSLSRHFHFSTFSTLFNSRAYLWYISIDSKIYIYIIS